MKTYMRTEKDLASRKWYIFDADGKVLGRLATQIANTLRGKRKIDYTPHMDSGDFVVCINATKVKLTGNKMTDKIYYKHNFQLGKLKETPANEMLKKHPEDVIKLAVKGMLPKNRLGRALLSKLKVYPGAEHPHKAQTPGKAPELFA
jgi:large subunit ribosomal protein L13